MGIPIKIGDDKFELCKRKLETCDFSWEFLSFPALTASILFVAHFGQLVAFASDVSTLFAYVTSHHSQWECGWTTWSVTLVHHICWQNWENWCRRKFASTPFAQGVWELLLSECSEIDVSPPYRGARMAIARNTRVTPGTGATPRLRFVRGRPGLGAHMVNFGRNQVPRN